jgi:microcystin degradation protein MlrC
MNIFFGALVTESNSFSNIPTSRRSFVKHSGREALETDYLLSSYVRHFARRAAEIGATPRIGMCAYATPSAPVVHADYLSLRDELLADLTRSGPVDAVFLYLHGAMVSDACFDCEGDILRLVRRRVGPKVPVLVVLDPHAHLTPDMVENADLLAFMKEYPHTDGTDRLDDLFRIVQAIWQGRVRPVPGVAACRIVGLWPTQLPPVRALVDKLIALEDGERILSISFVHGFPWGDTPHTGSRVLVYSNADSGAAQAVASAIAEEVWEMRASSQPRLLSIDAALDAVAKADRGPLVLADVADNAGGGAPADSSFILREVLARGMTQIAFALFYDPILVDFCRQAGVGGRLQARIGGKLSAFSGEPVNLEVEVKGLASGAVQIAFGNTPDNMGDTAWIQGGGVDVIVNSVRTQCFDPTAFTHLGLDCGAKRALVVKSTNHFQLGFAPLSKGTLLVATPGALNMDFARVPYRVFHEPYWPRNEDVHA